MYEASSLGRLRSLDYKRTGKTKVLKPALSKDGYLQTMLLGVSGKYHSWKVHKFIALAFMGERPIGLEINHKDGIKTNNRSDNLEYITKSENLIHAYKLGLIEPKRGHFNGMAKLTNEDVLTIRKHAKDNSPRYGRQALADRFGISSAHVKDLVNGRRGIWSHI